MAISPVNLFKKTVKFNEINFNKGYVKRFGLKFSGTIDDILRNGDKITLTVEKGRVSKSIREGKENFTKLFFPSDDKFHDMVYKYDKSGKLISRMKKITHGFRFSDGDNNTLKTTMQFIDDTASVIKHSQKTDDTTSIITYRHKKPYQIRTKNRQNEDKLLVDFKKGYLNIQKGKYFAKMKDGILEVQDKSHEYRYDFNKRTLSLDGEPESLIANHPHHAYDSTTSFETLKRHCKEFIPEKMGTRFYELVIKPMLKTYEK